ncbi:MAG: hypothetical protein AB1758_07470 [Candidatus Eremiobacterota bacterium]
MRGRDGYTLVECLLCLGLSFLVLGLLAVTLDRFLRASRDTSRVDQASETVRIALHWLARDVSQAAAVDSPFGASPEGRLSVRLQMRDLEPRCRVDYYRVADRLHRRVDDPDRWGGPIDQVLCRGVTSFRCQRDANGAVEVCLTSSGRSTSLVLVSHAPPEVPR